QSAIQSLKENKTSFAIQGKGRTQDEIAFALVAEGQYKGFGFFDRTEAICTIEDYEPFLKLQQSSYHTHAIIRSHLKLNGARNVVYFDEPLQLTKSRIKTITNNSAKKNKGFFEFKEL